MAGSHRFGDVGMRMQIPPEIPRSALVTGGARRIGRSVALALARSGFSVAVHCSGSREAAEATAAEIRGLGAAAVVLPADLGCEAAVRRLVADAAAALGPIGVLVNNASAFERDEWHDATRESWDAHLEPNLRAPFVLMQDFARALPAEGAGSRRQSARSARVVADPAFRVLHRLQGGAVDIDPDDGAGAGAAHPRQCGGPRPHSAQPAQSQAQFDAQCASVPLRHGSSPEEIGDAVLAMLHLRSMTGQMIALDGGQHLQWGATGGAIGSATGPAILEE